MVGGTHRVRGVTEKVGRTGGAHRVNEPAAKWPGHSQGRTSMKRLSHCLLVLSLFLIPLRSTAQQAPTLYEGARLIAGDGSAPIENSAFLVVGNRIAQVGRKGEIAAPAGASRVDLSGKTVIPGIVDAHGHPGFLDMVTGK